MLLTLSEQVLQIFLKMIVYNAFYHTERKSYPVWDDISIILTVPSVLGMADVEEEVELFTGFVANAS